MGQTRVDLLHLLEDLRDAYPGSLEETILSEVVAKPSTPAPGGSPSAPILVTRSWW